MDRKNSNKPSGDEEKSSGNEPGKKGRHDSLGGVRRQRIMSHIPKPPSQVPPQESASSPAMKTVAADQPQSRSAVEVATWKDKEEDKKKKKLIKPEFPKPAPLQLPIDDLMKTFGVTKQKAKKAGDDDEQEGDKLRNVAIKSLKKKPEMSDPILQRTMLETQKNSEFLKEKLRQTFKPQKDAGVAVPFTAKVMEKRFKKKEEEPKPKETEEDSKKADKKEREPSDDFSDHDVFKDHTKYQRYPKEDHAAKKRQPHTELHMAQKEPGGAEKEKKKSLELKPDFLHPSKPRDTRKRNASLDDDEDIIPLKPRGSGLFNYKRSIIERTIDPNLGVDSITKEEPKPETRKTSAAPPIRPVSVPADTSAKSGQAPVAPVVQATVPAKGDKLGKPSSGAPKPMTSEVQGAGKLPAKPVDPRKSNVTEPGVTNITGKTLPVSTAASPPTIQVTPPPPTIQVTPPPPTIQVTPPPPTIQITPPPPTAELSQAAKKLPTSPTQVSTPPQQTSLPVKRPPVATEDPRLTPSAPTPAAPIATIPVTIAPTLAPPPTNAAVKSSPRSSIPAPVSTKPVTTVPKPPSLATSSIPAAPTPAPPPTTTVLKPIPRTSIPVPVAKTSATSAPASVATMSVPDTPTPASPPATTVPKPTPRTSIPVPVAKSSATTAPTPASLATTSAPAAPTPAPPPTTTVPKPTPRTSIPVPVAKTSATTASTPASLATTSAPAAPTPAPPPTTTVPKPTPRTGIPVPVAKSSATTAPTPALLATTSVPSAPTAAPPPTTAAVKPSPQTSLSAPLVTTPVTTAPTPASLVTTSVPSAPTAAPPATTAAVKPSPRTSLPAPLATTPVAATDPTPASLATTPVPAAPVPAPLGAKAGPLATTPVQPTLAKAPLTSTPVQAIQAPNKLGSTPGTKTAAPLAPVEPTHSPPPLTTTLGSSASTPAQVGGRAGLQTAAALVTKPVALVTSPVSPAPASPAQLGSTAGPKTAAPPAITPVQAAHAPSPIAITPVSSAPTPAQLGTAPGPKSVTPLATTSAPPAAPSTISGSPKDLQGKQAVKISEPPVVPSTQQVLIQPNAGTETRKPGVSDAAESPIATAKPPSPFQMSPESSKDAKQPAGTAPGKPFPKVAPVSQVLPSVNQHPPKETPQPDSTTGPSKVVESKPGGTAVPPTPQPTVVVPIKPQAASTIKDSGKSDQPTTTVVAAPITAPSHANTQGIKQTALAKQVSHMPPKASPPGGAPKHAPAGGPGARGVRFSPDMDKPDSGQEASKSPGKPEDSGITGTKTHKPTASPTIRDLPKRGHEGTTSHGKSEDPGATGTQKINKAKSSPTIRDLPKRGQKGGTPPPTALKETIDVAPIQPKKPTIEAAPTTEPKDFSAAALTEPKKLVPTTAPTQPKNVSAASPTEQKTVSAPVSVQTEPKKVVVPTPTEPKKVGAESPTENKNISAAVPTEPIKIIVTAPIDKKVDSSVAPTEPRKVSAAGPVETEKGGAVPSSPRDAKMSKQLSKSGITPSPISSPRGSLRPSSPRGSPRPSSPRGSPRPSSPRGSLRPSSPRGSLQPSSPRGSLQPSSPRGSLQPSSPRGSLQPSSPRGSLQKSSSAPIKPPPEAQNKQASITNLARALEIPSPILKRRPSPGPSPSKPKPAQQEPTKGAAEKKPEGSLLIPEKPLKPKNSGLTLAQQLILKPTPKIKKPHSVKKLGEKNEEEIAKGVLNRLTQKVLEGGGDLNRLQDFGIPEQRRLLNLILHSDFGDYEFGGYMRECYSPVLRGFCAMNMQERYRGGGRGEDCFSSLDISKVGTKIQFKDRDRVKKLAEREQHLNELHNVAMDERHFKFLKELANNQPVSIPLTIIHELAAEILPMHKEMWEFYAKNLGNNHECTLQAGRSFIELLNRVIMYNAL